MSQIFFSFKSGAAAKNSCQNYARTGLEGMVGNIRQEEEKVFSMIHTRTAEKFCPIISVLM